MEVPSLCLGRRRPAEVWTKEKRRIVAALLV